MSGAHKRGSTAQYARLCSTQVITAFITSRMELVSALLRHGADLDDPLADDEQLTEQLDTLPSLCRFQLQQVRARPIARGERGGGVRSSAAWSS